MSYGKEIIYHSVSIEDPQDGTGILDDVWECAATTHAEAEHVLKTYQAHPGLSLYKRAEADRDMAQRVLDWITELRSDDG